MSDTERLEARIAETLRLHAWDYVEEPLCQCSRPDLPSPHRAHSADWDRACPSLPDAEWTAMHDRHAAIGWRCLQCPRPATPKEQK